MASYLNDRHQTTQVGAHVSKKGCCTNGVLQGSVLGSLLFLSYKNYIYTSSEKLSFFLFADNTNLLYGYMSFHELSTDCRIFVLSSALMKVSDCVPDIIYVREITWKTINNALPILNWELDFFGFKVLPQFLAHKNRLKLVFHSKTNWPLIRSEAVAWKETGW